AQPTSASGRRSKTLQQRWREETAMTAIFNLRFTQPRRDFLKAGAGLTLGVFLAPKVFAQGAGPGRAGGEVVATAALEPNAFVRIGADNTVTVIVKHIEMGQGTYTGLPSLVAEAPE